MDGTLVDQETDQNHMDGTNVCNFAAPWPWGKGEDHLEPSWKAPCKDYGYNVHTQKTVLPADLSYRGTFLIVKRL